MPEGGVDLERHRLVHGPLRLAEHLVGAIERGVGACQGLQLAGPFRLRDRGVGESDRLARVPLQPADLAAHGPQGRPGRDGVRRALPLDEP